MTQRELDFPALAARLRPQCEAIVARYEERRSALLPIVHLFQEHEGYASREAMRFTAAPPADIQRLIDGLRAEL